MDKNKTQLFTDFIEMLSSNYVTNDQKTFKETTTAEITHRDEQYTNLLKHFVGITKVRNVLKEIFKWVFFCIVVGSLAMLCYIISMLFINILNRGTVEQVISSIPLLTSAMVGFISAIIAVPITIAKYLFSKEEDNNITKIILHTQKHDTSGRQWITNSQDDNLKGNDSSIKKDDEINAL